MVLVVMVEQEQQVQLMQRQLQEQVEAVEHHKLGQVEQVVLEVEVLVVIARVGQ